MPRYPRGEPRSGEQLRGLSSVPTCRHCCARQMPARVADARTSVCSSRAALQCTRRAMDAPTRATRSCSGGGQRWCVVHRVGAAVRRCLNPRQQRWQRYRQQALPLLLASLLKSRPGQLRASQAAQPAHLLGVVRLCKLWRGQQLRHPLLTGGHSVHGLGRAAGARAAPAGRSKGRGMVQKSGLHYYGRKQV